MKELKKGFGTSKFSHIYVEERAYKYPMTQKILDRFKDVNIITIDHYKNVFNRPKQNFWKQKESQGMILAVKEEPFLYEGPDICEDFGNKNFYYTSAMLNCIYDCHYCYLQGMYQSAHIVIFVNIEEFFDAVDRQLKNLDHMYLCTSYDTDLLALEGIVPYSRQWIEYARAKDGLLMELRTKSVGYDNVSDIRPYPNIILAWTLSPEEIIKKYEGKAPSLKARMDAVCDAIEDGWNVRLSLEPILKVENWENIYTNFVHTIATTIPMDKIYDMNIGIFRMSRDYFKKISKNRVDTDVFSYPIDVEDGVAYYKEEELMKGTVARELFKYYPDDKIYL